MLELPYILLRFQMFPSEFNHKLVCCFPKKCESLKIPVVLNVILSRWANISRRFEESQCVRNVGNYAASDVLSHSRILESLAETLL
jgi:hypothetical protein